MTEYKKLEDELKAAKGYRADRQFSAFANGVVGTIASVISGASFEEPSDYKWGAAFAFLALVHAIACAGNFLKLYEANGNVTRIQREIGYIKQEGLEKKLIKD